MVKPPSQNIHTLAQKRISQ